MTDSSNDPQVVLDRARLSTDPGTPVLIDADGRVLVRMTPDFKLVGDERYIAKPTNTDRKRA